MQDVGVGEGAAVPYSDGVKPVELLYTSVVYQSSVITKLQTGVCVNSDKTHTHTSLGQTDIKKMCITYARIFKPAQMIKNFS